MIMASNEAGGIFRNHTVVNAKIGVIIYRNYQGTLDIQTNVCSIQKRPGFVLKDPVLSFA